MGKEKRKIASNGPAGPPAKIHRGGRRKAGGTRKQRGTSPTVEERLERQVPAPADLVPVVGVGASAGGLDAFRQLLKALPADTGLAYVLVQHLDPRHESVLAELLAKSTSMPVAEEIGRAHV